MKTRIIQRNYIHTDKPNFIVQEATRLLGVGKEKWETIYYKIDDQSRGWICAEYAELKDALAFQARYTRGETEKVVG